MDYVTQQIDMYVQQYNQPDTKMVALQYVRVKVEYGLLFLLGYLWNKKHKNARNDVRISILRSLRRPTIGQIIDNIKLLDYDRECGARSLEVLNAYRHFRNEYLGHGYIFPDGTDVAYKMICELELAMYRIPILQQRYDLVYVQKINNSSVSGVRYVADGQFMPWNAHYKVHPFAINHVYAVKKTLFRAQYVDLSPFFLMKDLGEFYLFRNIEEYLTGRVMYNRVLQTGTLTVEYEDFSDVSLEQNELKRRSVNNTIINHYTNNYHTYFEVGPLKQKIKRFLRDDRANVCCTIWGHGGVGKTALIQSICDELTIDQSRVFDYIIFASAKDRQYNVYINQIEERSGQYTSYEGVIRLINQVVFNQTNNTTTDDLYNSSARMLFVIDDFETFPDAEKRKIEEFIRSLDINRHKVVITTRANTVIGEVFNVDELDPITASNFVTQLLTSGEYQIANIESFTRQLEDEDTYLRVHEVTQGRPLFLYALVSIWVQERSLENTLKHQFGSYREAIDFLYGRVYDYLSSLAQDIFVVMSQLVSEQELTNLSEKLYYILDISTKPPFEKAMRELVKLRIIEEIDSTFFRIYSVEILVMMRERYQQRNVTFQQRIAQRIAQISIDPRLNNDLAMLQNALAARNSLPKEQVVEKFIALLNSGTCAYDVKLEAMCGLGEYVAEICLDPQNAIELMVTYVHVFGRDVRYVRMLATYLWVEWRRKESIEWIQELFTQQILKYDQNPTLWMELKGTLVERQGIDVLARFDEALRAQETFTLSDEQLIIYQAQFRLILQSGRDLWEHVNDTTDISTLDLRVRICVIKGLYQMVLLNQMLGDLEQVQAICDVVLSRFPITTNLYEQFRQIQRKITQSSQVDPVTKKNTPTDAPQVTQSVAMASNVVQHQLTPEDRQRIMIDYILTDNNIGKAYPMFKMIAPVLRSKVVTVAWQKGGVWRAFVAGLADSSILKNLLNLDSNLSVLMSTIETARQYFVRHDIYIDSNQLLEIIIQANKSIGEATDFNIPSSEHPSVPLERFVNHVRRSKNIGEGYPLYKNIDGVNRIRAIQVAWQQGNNWRALVAGLANEYTLNALYAIDGELRHRRKAIEASRQYFQRNDIRVDQQELIQIIRSISKITS
jgi:hypothetical protein